jgi:hypothetical protein
VAAARMAGLGRSSTLRRSDASTRTARFRRADSDRKDPRLSRRGLREMVEVERSARRGVRCTDGEAIIATGAGHGRDQVANHFVGYLFYSVRRNALRAPRCRVDRLQFRNSATDRRHHYGPYWRSSRRMNRLASVPAAGSKGAQGLPVCSPQYILARGRFAGISTARRCAFRHLAATAVCPRV